MKAFDPIPILALAMIVMLVFWIRRGQPVAPVVVSRIRACAVPAAEATAVDLFRMAHIKAHQEAQETFSAELAESAAKAAREAFLKPYSMPVAPEPAVAPPVVPGEV